MRHTADHVVLACGADPFIPPIPGLRELDGVWTNREVTGMKAVPRRLLVLGGGPVGVEMAQAVRRLGGEVVLVEAADRVLAREPAPLGEALGEVLRRRRHRARARRRTSPRARRDGDDYVLELDDGRELRGDRLLVATGRRPRVDGHRPRDRRHRARRRAAIAGRRAPARRRAAVGDRRRHRHLAAHPRRQVPGPRGRLEHPRRAARGQLRGRPAGRPTPTRRPRRGRGDRGALQRDRARLRGGEDRHLHARVRGVATASSRCSATASGSPAPTRSAPRPASGCSRPRWRSAHACRSTSCSTRSSRSRRSRRSTSTR